MKIKYLSLLAIAAIFSFSFSCGQELVSPNSGQVNGIGGSMARFAVNGNYLYTVDHHSLNLFDIRSPDNPTHTNRVSLGIGIETIFPYQDKLFIGSQVGMHILSLQTPDKPKLIASYEHIFSCDPVVTDGRYAYVTLSGTSACPRGINELQIIDLKNIASPQLIKRYPMYNPRGLGIDGNLLFVCDKGLKVYDASDVLSLKLKNTFQIDAYDVILNNGIALVIGRDGLYQYAYNDQDFEFLSKISVQSIQ